MDDILDKLLGLVAILSAVALPIGFGMYLGLCNIRSKHKEKMEALRLGIPLPETKGKTPNSLASLRNGILCFGIGLGLIVSFILLPIFDVDRRWEIFIIGASILIFLGIGYIVYYCIADKKEKKDNNTDFEG